MSAKKKTAKPKGTAQKLPEHHGRTVKAVSTAKEAHEMAKKTAAEQAAKFPGAAGQRAKLSKPWQSAAVAPAKAKKR